MAQRIRRFGVGQTAKVIGVLYTLMGLVFAPFILLAALFAPEEAGMGIGFAVAMPIFYGVAGFIFSAIGCVIYNAVASRVGGIEVQMDETTA